MKNRDLRGAEQAFRLIKNRGLRGVEQAFQACVKKQKKTLPCAAGPRTAKRSALRGKSGSLSLPYKTRPMVQHQPRKMDLLFVLN